MNDSEPKIDKRPSWDEYFMTIAHATAVRSTCPRRAVGAVLVYDRRIIATGYNGAPRNMDHCPTSDPAGHPSCMVHGHCVRTIHAEVNAILACAAAGVSTRDATIYATTCPCPACMGVIINAQIGVVQYASPYSDPSHIDDRHAASIRIAEQAGLQLVARPDLSVGSQPK